MDCKNTSGRSAAESMRCRWIVKKNTYLMSRFPSINLDDNLRQCHGIISAHPREEKDDARGSGLDTKRLLSELGPIMANSFSDELIRNFEMSELRRA